MSQELDYLKSRVTAGKLSRREFVGRAAILGIGSVAASSLFTTAAHAAKPKKGGTIRAGISGGQSTDTLDPALFTNEVSGAVARHMMDRLVDVSPKGKIINRLAAKVDASKDARVWNFKIRKGVEFHNGKTLTADDVLKTVERHSNEKTKSGALGLLRDIEDLRVKGDRFTVTLKTPNADFPYLMSDAHLAIQPGGGFDNPDAGIGTGPYAIEVNEPGVRHGFKKFRNYWDDSIAHADEVEILTINDSTARNAALQSGKVHMINRVDPKVAGLLARAKGVSVQSVAGRGHYVFIMHIDTAPFGNNDLRMALKLGINRKEMVDKILRGYGSLGNDMPINLAYPFFDDSIPQREYDPDKAAFHYKKSGHDGSPIILRTADGAFPGAVEAAQLFQQSAKAAGIPLEIKREPNDGYWSEVWNVKPFSASFWGGRPTQDQMYSTAYLSTADWNDTRFKREDFDALLLKARAELSSRKRKKLYSQMGYLVRDEGGLIAPMYNDWVDGVSDKIAGFESDPNWGLMNLTAPTKCWLA